MRKPFNVRLPQALHAEVAAVAREQGITQSDLVIAALHRFIAELRTRQRLHATAVKEMFDGRDTSR